MNNESRSLVISLVAGILAAFLLYSYSQEKKAEYDKTYGTMKNVVVAKVDIEQMRTIDGTMLEVVQRPADFIEPGAIQDPEIAVGQVAGKPIKKNEQVLDSKLLLPGADTGISLQDSGRGMQTKREVSMIMQDVVVLATGINVVNNLPRTIESDSNGKNMVLTNLSGDTKYNSITIEATPKEAQDLIYIVSSSPSNIFFTLRNPNDRTVPPRIGSSSSDTIMGRVSVESTPAVGPASVAPPTVIMPPAQPVMVPRPQATPVKRDNFKNL